MNTMSTREKKLTVQQKIEAESAKMMADAPNFADSMTEITTIIGTVPTQPSSQKERYFTDEKGTFKEMDESESDKTTVAE